MKHIECRTIRHSYDGVHYALLDLELRINAGEVMALIGPNGAGKSTTLRILATLQRPDGGSVLWDGQDAWENRYEIRRRIGFLGDGQALYPTMTAAAYLGFFAECYGLEPDRAREQVTRLLGTFGLTKTADRAIHELSKGMRQRLAIARTLVHGPELLLLDEPADGLDPLARRELRETLRAVADQGVAIVVSSHILRELDGFCDTVALIQKGQLEVHGTVEKVIADYEVSRRVHEIVVLHGLQRALERLRGRRGLVEGVAPLSKGDSPYDPTSADAGVIRARIHGDEEETAVVLRDLVLAGVGVASIARVRSDLEDVYHSMGRDEVN